MMEKSEKLEFQINEKPPLLVVTLLGEIQRSTGAELLRCSEELVAKSSRFVIICLKGVNRIAKNGYPDFIRFQQSLRDAGKVLRLSEIHSDQYEELNLSAVIRPEEVVDTLPNAIKAAVQQSQRNQVDPILVVDDETAILKLVTRILQEESVPVVSAQSAMVAIELLEKRYESEGQLNISAILTDWQMEQMTGLDLLLKIRERPYGQVPVILMSGKVPKEKIQKAVEGKADAIVLKPIQKENLLERLAPILMKQRKKTSP